MSERFQVVLESSDPALSVVLLRRLLKHVGRTYRLRAVAVRRESPATTPKGGTPGRREAPRRPVLVTPRYPGPRQAPPGGCLRMTGGLLTQRSEPAQEDS